MSEKEDAQLGRTVRWFGRWWGGSMIVCLVLLLFFGEGSKWSDWIFATSIISGALIAVWLTRAEKKREAALQSPKDVVE